VSGSWLKTVPIIFTYSEYILKEIYYIVTFTFNTKPFFNSIGIKTKLKTKRPVLKRAGRAEVEAMCSSSNMLVFQYERNMKKIIVLEFRKSGPIYPKMAYKV
jgi:hypothetical protein